MFLCDAINQAAHARGKPEALGVPREAANHPVIVAQLAAAAALAERCTGATRHVLDDDAIEAASQVLMSRPRSIRDCMSVLRVPWRAAWFEWREAARIDLRRKLGAAVENDRDTPARVGFLVTADAEGRRGTVHMAWIHGASPAGDMPEVSPLTIAFNLDQADDESVWNPTDRDRASSDLYRKWMKSQVDMDAITQISRAFRHEATADHRAMHAAVAATLGRDAAAEWMGNADQDIAGEQIGFLTVMMLMASRNAVGSQPGADRAKLNKIRARKGEAPLLDHVVVSMRLGAAARRSADGDGTPEERRSRRAHMVVGHFVSRQGSIFYRRPHGRGFGGPAAAVTRTVLVST